MEPTALRIFYMAGPGDVIGTFRHWQAGKDDPSQVAITYSGQFYQLCKELGASGFVVSTNPRQERIEEDGFVIEHRPTRFERGPGVLFHLGRIWYTLGVVISAVRFKADVAIISDGAIHWFVLGLMKRYGVRVIPSIHCVLWPRNHGTRGMLGRLFMKLNGRFFQQKVAAILSLSNDISEQIRLLLSGAVTPIVSFLPSYRRDEFGEGFGAPAMPLPFRVFYAGRIERNKGVFDLLAIAGEFKKQGRRDIEFDLCGDGSQLLALRAAVGQAGLEETFRCHGHSTKQIMRGMYEQCHVVIVPTTADFMEGFNKVVAEGMLAGRPVITSVVCPALEYVKEGVVEVPADNAEAYGKAIIQLKEDPVLYEAKRLGCRIVRGQFYDSSKSWGAAVKSAIKMTNQIRAEGSVDNPALP